MKHIKCIVVGDHLVGKSCLIYTYLCRSFPNSSPPIVLEGTYDKIIKCDDIPINHIIDDVNGKDDYKHIRHFKYPKTDVFIICFSLVSRITFENVKKVWVPEIEEYCPSIPYILVGTKSDLKRDQEHNLGDNVFVSTTEGELMMNEIRAQKYIECSSLRNENVDEVFNSAFRVVLQNETNYSQKRCCLY